MQGFKLLFKIIIAIALGVVLGSIVPEWSIKVFTTFNDIFGSFLGFIIPLIILGFIVPGIGSLGKGAGKLLGLTALIAYASTVIAGIVAFFVAKGLYPTLLKGQTSANLDDPSEGAVEGFLEFVINPPMDVLTALLLAFVLGIGIAAIKASALLNIMNEFKGIIELVINKVIIPLLPFHIFGIFANMTYTGTVSTIISVFAKVFLLIIILHLLYLIAIYVTAGTMSRQNPFQMLKTMSPAYFTALGTQSSAATIPVTLQSAKQLKIRPNVADFTVPLLANIHLAGSTITILCTALAVMFIQGDMASFSSILPFLLVLGVTMIAAPGVPGGAVMAAIGLLEAMLGFGPTMVSLMIALYLAQDSIGTACNVTGDGAITTIVDALHGKDKVA
ncbi:MAG TPA: dicarboxylate/amino acid:cation symporter [Pseudogracilibacillus sp.]|nr:dicarboxylate/amino acid:cation symporter [Pseudogracilibacillus sp.]